ncbi:MAG: ABC transporter ATP-binding protein [Thermoanaerobaculia bacterium]
MSTGLRFESVTRRFGKLDALTNFGLQCPSGSMTCLVGPNGAGKSTALALAAGLLPPTSGQITVSGATVELATPSESTGYLPQRSSFHALLTAGEVLDLACAIRSVGARARRQVLEVTGLREVLDQPVGNLSGGWLRRLGLLSCLVGSPQLLLLDEPFVGLDPETHERLVNHLEDRLESGATVLVASHDFEVLDRFNPHTVVLVEGRLQYIEAPGNHDSNSSDTRDHQTSRSIYLEALSGNHASSFGKVER